MAIAAGQRSAAAHPRSRGENVHCQQLPDIPAGSSPLTRGKRAGPVPRPPLARLIPAHAGKTPVTVRVMDLISAHPRSRGENGSSLGSRFGPAGSSPLTRGKHRRETVSYPSTRLIPAHAGKTILTGIPSSLRRAHPRSRGENK